MGGSGGALGELWEAQGQLWEALAELWEALGELWEALYIKKLTINRKAAVMLNNPTQLSGRGFPCMFYIKLFLT